MAGLLVSCRTWLFFDLRLEWGPPSFMASFPPSGEGVLVWRRVTGWEICGVGTFQLLSLPEEVASPRSWVHGSYAFLMGHLI